MHRGFPYILFAGTIALIAHLSLLLERSLEEQGSGERCVAGGTKCLILVKCSVCISFACVLTYVCVCVYVFVCVCIYMHCSLSVYLSGAMTTSTKETSVV